MKNFVERAIIDKVKKLDFEPAIVYIYVRACIDSGGCKSIRQAIFVYLKANNLSNESFKSKENMYNRFSKTVMP